VSDFLTIAGIAVPMQAYAEQEPDRAGEEFRTFDLTLASQVRAEKRRWAGETSFLTATEVAALKTATALDTAVTVVLTMIRDGVTVTTTVTARVRLVAEASRDLAGLYTARMDVREI
jgi:hypothetical protein